MFDDFVNLRPLKGVADIFANDDTWGQLYDLDQLAKNTVKINAATYVIFLLITPVTANYCTVHQVLRRHVRTL